MVIVLPFCSQNLHPLSGTWRYSYRYTVGKMMENGLCGQKMEKIRPGLRALLISPTIKGGRVWNSPQEFLNMNDEKYEDAYVIPTTKKQDKQITEGFRKSQDINYDLLEANCSIAVQSGLKAGGLKDGSLSRLEKTILKYSPTSNMHKAIIELSPVHIFSRIRNQNKNGTWLKRQK